MRTLVFWLLVICGTLFSAVSFQYQYNLPELQTADELNQIILYDMDDDQIDEIIVSYTNPDVYRIIVYNQLGSIMDIVDYPNVANSEIVKFDIFTFQDTKYISFLIDRNQVNGNQISNYCVLQILEWETGILITEEQIFIGQYNPNGNTEYSFTSNFLKSKNYNFNEQLFIGLSKNYSWQDDLIFGSSKASKLYYVLFDGISLNVVQEYINCGTNILFISNTTFYTTGHNRESNNYQVQAWDGSREYYIKKLNCSSPPYINTVWSIYGYYSGDFQFGTSYNNFPNAFNVLKFSGEEIDYGFPFYLHINDNNGNIDKFLNYDVNSNNQVWENNYSELIESGFTIQSSSMVSTNLGDHFVMYFGKDNPDIYRLELRDLISGNYVITEEAPFIPKAIRKNQDNETLYFNVIDSGTDVYSAAFSLSSLIPRFTVSDTTSYSPFNVTFFNDNSYGNIVSWAWDFNSDGVIDSNEENPNWTYYEAGYYDVSLTVSDGSNSETIVKENFIHVLPPEASFSFNIDNGVVPLTVDFTDTSIDSIVSWEWDFENDGIIDSYEQNPTWTFNNIGTFSIKLTVSDGTNFSSFLMEDCLEVLPFILDFEANPHIAWIPVSIHFEDLTEGVVDSWAWDFDGDGVIDSNQQNPEWNCDQVGWYDVSLTIENSYAVETLTKENFIHAIFVQYGSIFEDTIWEVDTVNVINDITVEENVTVTILPGTTVVLNPESSIYVEGNIISEGMPDNVISFLPKESSWKSILFEDTPSNADSSLFDYTIFSNSRGINHSSSNITSGGALYLSGFSKIRISNSQFYNNEADRGGAIFLGASSPKILDCFFNTNTAEKGGAIYSTSSNSLIENSFFTDNSADFGGAFFLGSTSLIIDNCVLHDNQANDGGAIYFDGSTSEIINCKIFSNSSDRGAVFYKFSNSPIKNTIFSNNVATNGGAVFFQYFQPVIENCVFWNNDATDYNRGATFYFDNSSPRIYNSIFWHSDPLNALYQIYIPDIISFPAFQYCDVQGEMSSFSGQGSINFPDSLYLNNIDIEPQFIDPTNVIGISNFVLDADWMLASDSPCIDAGNPDPLYNDPEDPMNPGFALFPALGSITNDMGAYGGPNSASWYFTAADEIEIPDYSYQNILSNFPNPFNPNTTISFEVPQTSSFATIEIYNLKGQKVKTFLINPSTFQLINSVTWNGTDDNNKPVSSGVYFYRLKSNNIDVSRKCLLLK